MIEVNTDNIQLLWQAIHNERQRIKLEIKELEGICERDGITELDELDQLKEEHKELLKMEKSLEDILIR